MIFSPTSAALRSLPERLRLGLGQTAEMQLGAAALSSQDQRPVRREVEAGTYSSGVLPVHVDSLPNAKRFLRLGNGTLVHDMNGFTVEGKTDAGEDFRMHKTVPSLYSCHIEYEYLGKYGDCIDLNTLEDTWYIYPEGRDFSVTKMALATEELYFHHRREAEKEKHSS